MLWNSIVLLTLINYNSMGDVVYNYDSILELSIVYFL